MKRLLLNAFFISVISSSTLTYALPKFIGYEASEHVAVGDSVKLQLPMDDYFITGNVVQLPNQMRLSFGQILSLGDFYGIVDKPVTEAINAKERRERFLAAFNSFAVADVSVELTQILAVVKKEQQAVADGLNKGEQLVDIFKNMDEENGRQYNCITGGGCSTSLWWLNQGRYLKLAARDIDHFGARAVITYQTGHQLAIDTALSAREKHDPKQLELAYAMEAFAAHFITDRFSAGHMRTPRTELLYTVTPSVLGSLIVNYMHHEESVYGLHVHNAKGNRWFAMGDRFYFDAANRYNRLLLEDVLQQSVNEVYAAYQSGEPTTKSDILSRIPEPDEAGSNVKYDIAPLFYWDDRTHKVMRRVDMKNVYDHHWTSNWYGWETFLELSRERGLLPDKT